jgi:hypothetical protein
MFRSGFRLREQPVVRSGMKLFSGRLSSQQLPTGTQVAENSRQVKRLCDQRFVGHKAGQGLCVLRKILRRDRPALNGRPAKNDGDISSFAMQMQPTCVFVGEVEWQEQRLPVAEGRQEPNPFRYKLHRSGGRTKFVVFAVRLQAKIIAFPRTGFRTDLNGDLIVGI